VITLAQRQRPDTGHVRRGDMVSPVNVFGALKNLLPKARSKAEEIAKTILELRAVGRSNEVTEEMMKAADDKYMFDNTPLDMSQEARMARADEMGFDVDNVSYHGTKVASLDKFDPKFIKQGLGGKVIYSTDTPIIASDYAGIAKGSGVLPLLLQGKRKAMNASDLAKGKNKYFENVRENIQTAKDEGFFGMDLQTTDPTGAKVQTTFDLSDVRSQFARFDPEFSNLRNLSASILATIGFTGLAKSLRQNENGGQM
jgi:hypothetical protein